MDTSTLADVAREVATMIEHEANVRAVFGEPIKLETKVIVPVVTIAFGGGGGALSKIGGGGGGLDVRPAGFLCEEDGKVVFTRIELPIHRK